VGGDPQQPPRRHRRRLAPERQRPGVLGRHGVVNEPVGGLADEDLAGLRLLLEAGGDVHGVAQDDRLSDGPLAGEDLARVDAGPHGDGEAPDRRELGVQRGERRPQLVGGPHRAQGVVLVDARQPEHRHHRVADELLDHALMAIDDAPHLREVARHHVPQRFGVERLAELRRALDVREEHRHDLAGLRRDVLLAHRSLVTGPGPGP
jgi:hypothetical protein